MEFSKFKKLMINIYAFHYKRYESDFHKIIKNFEKKIHSFKLWSIEQKEDFESGRDPKFIRNIDESLKNFQIEIDAIDAQFKKRKTLNRKTYDLFLVLVGGLFAGGWQFWGVRPTLSSILIIVGVFFFYILLWDASKSLLYGEKE